MSERPSCFNYPGKSDLRSATLYYELDPYILYPGTSLVVQQSCQGTDTTHVAQVTRYFGIDDEKLPAFAVHEQETDSKYLKFNAKAS